MHHIEAHVHHLARYTHHTLRSMRHAGGTPVACLYLAAGDTWGLNSHGSIVNFNLKNPDGSYVGYAQVERVASLYNIHLRTGCVCNPGACQAYLGITHEKLIGQFKAEELCIPLNPTEPLDTTGASLCGGRVCGVRVQGLDCGEEAGDWLSRMLGMPDLRLMMQTSHRPGKLGNGGSGASGESLSLANESQYLIIHRPSVRSLLREIKSRGLEELTEDELVKRFRGNLVTDGGEAYEEDSWDTLTINGTTLQVQGCCRRCQMVCVVPGSGQRTREPMLSLSAARGSSMLFGVHASASPAPAKEKRELCMGASIKVTMK
ncbi:Molybdenum cofactor sulfurase [Portunus trituberculatus]|uniref:Molybdenum cofactor sulfurase n=1 Tax=Portunus trituberculatus TaxID=210409 RepID=A0A5B7CS10_PORTR|nr:Molybdenum cofactor sulfurase [Portunus trituberculatus]